jgi:hypothetical protein
VEGNEREGIRRHGVVFVHGVGDQRKSDTLLDFGKPLLEWLKGWYAARGAPAPQVSNVRLAFSPVDVGDGDPLPRGVVHLPARGAGQDDGPSEWVWAEAWWATSNRHPDFFTVLTWSVRYLWQIMRRLRSATAQRWYRLFPGHNAPDSTAPPFAARLVDLLNTMGMLALYLLGSIAGYPVALTVMLLAQIPIPVVQDFVLLRVLRRFLMINAGEFRTLLTDDLQASNMSRRVSDAVAWLVSEAGGRCRDVTIIAHSAGAVVSYEMLTDPACASTAARVRKLITVGAGLNKAWDIAPDLPRLQRALPAHIHWLDLWASYDPVPAGWLEPPLVDTRPGAPAGGRARIFAPSPEVAVTQRLTPRVSPDPYAPAGDTAEALKGPAAAPPVFWPVSEQVTNRMNVLSDHGGYWANDEQVLVRFAAEIDAPYHRESPFWSGDATLEAETERTEAMRRAVLDRRSRVSVLAAVRAGVVGVALLTAWRFLTELWAWTSSRGPSFWAVTYKEVKATGLPLLDLTSGFLQLVWDVALRIPIAGGLLTPLLTIPYWALGPAVLAIAAILFYLWVPGILWDRWDARARSRANREMARAGR